MTEEMDARSSFCDLGVNEERAAFKASRVISHISPFYDILSSATFLTCLSSEHGGATRRRSRGRVLVAATQKQQVEMIPQTMRKTDSLEGKEGSKRVRIDGNSTEEAGGEKEAPSLSWKLKKNQPGQISNE